MHKYKPALLSILLLTLAMVPGGCRSAFSNAQSLLKQTEIRLNTVQSQELSYQLVLNGGNVFNMPSDIIQSAVVLYTKNPFLVCMDGTNKIQWPDMSLQTGDILIYERIENGSYVDYMQTGGQWFCLPPQSSWTNPFFLVDDLLTLLLDDTQNIYHLQASRSHGYNEIIADVPIQKLNGLIPLSELAVIDYSDDTSQAPPVHITVQTVQNTNLPQKISFDMTDYVNNAAQAEGGSIDYYILTLTYTDFDHIEAIEVPERLQE